MLNDPEFEDYMTDLIDKGAVVNTGEFDPNGEPIYKFNLSVLKEIKPEMYAILMEELDADLVHLYQQGLVDISYNEDLEATFAVNEAGRHYMETGELPEPRV
jgi:hypothetical protein